MARPSPGWHYLTMAAHGNLMHVGVTGSNTLPPEHHTAWFDASCGHCGRMVSAAVVAYTYVYEQSTYIPTARWIRCTSCGAGSFVSHDGDVYPGPSVGRDVDGLPDNVQVAYDEARRCAQVNAFTACEMTCRKILMHIAVDKGAAATGLSFKGYVDYLEDNHHVTPAMKPWVDVIRKHGNIAVHDLPHVDRERALGTLTFTEHLLRNVYEMEHLAARFAPPTDSQE